MKKYSLIRKTLKFLGYDSETAKTEEVKVVSIDEYATVNYNGTGGDFSGNIDTVGDENTGIDAGDVVDQDSGTTGHILLGVEEITLHSGETYTLQPMNEDGADITSLVSLHSSNGHVTFVGTVLTAVDNGSATITVSETADPNVFSKIKVYVID